MMGSEEIILALCGAVKTKIIVIFAFNPPNVLGAQIQIGMDRDVI